MLAILSPRQIDSEHSIQFKNKLYLPVTENGFHVYLKKGTTAMIVESFDGNLYAKILDQIYIMQEIPEHELYSKNLMKSLLRRKLKNTIFFLWNTLGKTLLI